MERKRARETTSATAGKNDERKNENFLRRAVRSIRDKVHDFADDIKGKAHNATHSIDSKTKEKDKDRRTTGTEWNLTRKLPIVHNKESSSEAKNENDLPKQPWSRSTPSGMYNEKENVSINRSCYFV